MKILHITPWFPSQPNDQNGNFIYDSVKSLIDMGHEVTTLVTTAWKPKVAHFLDNNWKIRHIQIEKFPASMRIYNCSYISIPRHFLCPITLWNYNKVVSYYLKKIIKKHHIQIIHAQTEFAGMPAVKIGNQLNIPSVVTLHGISTEKKLYSGITRKKLFEYPLNHASSVILVGNPLLDFTKQFVNRTSHLKIIANGFRFSQENTLNEKKKWAKSIFQFISVSNLVEGKGIDINLCALSKLNMIGITNWTYKIVGGGCERSKLESLCEKLKLNNQVSFLGALNHDDVYKQLAIADIFILPSYREAFGVAYLEAMSCGLLTIGVEGQGPQTYITNGKSGFLVKPGSVDSLFSILQFIFNNIDSMPAIAEAGKLHVKQNFTWHQHAIHLTNLYKSLIQE